MSVLIKNVQIIGNAQPVDEYADILVQKEKVAALGHFPEKKADVVIDGQGAYCAPGFIDLNTTSDHYLSLLTYPNQNDFLLQGVTTIMGGIGGVSLAPLFQGKLEAFRAWADIRTRNVNWHTIKDFFAVWNNFVLGINFGTYIGYRNVRAHVLKQKLDRKELLRMGEIFQAALVDGGFGISMRIAPRDASWADLRQLSRLVQGVLLVVTAPGTPAREGYTEASKALSDAKNRILLHHTANAGENLHAPERLQENLYMDYPGAQICELEELLPRWAVKKDHRETLRILHDEWFQKRIAKELSIPHAKEVYLLAVPHSEHHHMVGQSLAALKESFGLARTGETLLKLMSITELRGTLLWNNNVSCEPLRVPSTVFSSHMPSLASNAQFPVFPRPFRALLKAAEQNGLASLKEAVKKITEEPARLLGLANRGIIREGAYGDLTVFKDGEIWSVLVNGAAAVIEGKITGACNGRMLRR